MSGKRFRIAFSFAGEKRNFVKETADILAGRFREDKILYDKYHEAEFANADLAFDLPTLYKTDADLIASVFCSDYDKKEWCGLEWRAIFSIIKEGGAKQVMLNRFDRVDGKGLHGLGGFVELDDKTPEQFATLILERLALNEGLSKDHYTKPVAPPVVVLKTDIPHNLPTLQPFFGREDELRKIADALDPDSRTWGALIDGPGGMGKTSLAVRAAYDASPEDFEKIIFVSLKTRELDDDGVRDLSGFILSGLVELLNELARELGCDDITKAPEDQRPRLLLDALRGTHTLLVLDNLESLVKPQRDTLFTFIKKLPTGCKAILTSRGRIGSGAEELILEKLSEEAALATLAELATHNPLLARTSEAERLVLYRETAGKPLLLRWTAGQLGRGHCLTFTDALHFIRSCPPGNDPLEFIFGDLVEDFSEDETKALCALTYFTLPAEVKHVASIAGLPEPETDHALRSLTVRSLAVPTDELKAFTLVPMVADFLRKKKPEVMAETGDRLEERAYALIMGNGYREFDRFPSLKEAWPIIAPALPLFITGANERLQDICRAFRFCLEYHGHWDEWCVLWRHAEEAAVREGDRHNAGTRAFQMGWFHYRRNQSAEVLACAERAAKHWQIDRQHDPNSESCTPEQASVMLMRGLAYRLSMLYPQSIEAFRGALTIFSRLDQLIEVTICLNGIATAERHAGYLVEAEKHLQEALGLARKIDFREGIASYTSGLAKLSISREDWFAAERFATESLPLSESVGREELVARACHRLAHALLRQGKAYEALPHARRAVEIFTRLGTRDLAKAQAILAECEG